MIVVAIIGILSAIALPAYNDYVLRGKLTEAYSELATMRVKMEQYYQDNRTYDGACTAGTVAPLPTGKYFTYSCPVANLSNTTYLVQASGISTQGTGSFTFTINQNNVRATTNTPAGWSSSSSCWVRWKDGSC